jgi:hypothetical protein
MIFADGLETTIRWMFNECPRMPLLVVGPTGQGKTQIPYGVWQEAYSRWKEAVDTSGDSRSEAQRVEVGKGEPGFLNQNLAQIDYAELGGLPEKQGDHMRYLPPDWLWGLSNYKRGILVFNEPNRMEIQARHAYMQLLDERCINGAKIPGGWVIVQTANPADEHYQVAAFDRALIRRSCTVMLADDTQVWQAWAMTRYRDPVTHERMDPAILALSVRLGSLMTKHGQVENRVEAVPTKAGLTMVDYMRKRGLMSLPREVRMEIVAGIIGPTGAGSHESQLSGRLLEKLIEAFEAGVQIEGQEAEVMFDLLFLAHERGRRAPGKYAHQLHVLWRGMPDDAKPVLAKACHGWFYEHRLEYAEFKLEYEQWLVQHADEAIRFSLPSTGGGKDES